MHREQENSWELPSRQPVSGMVLAILKAVIQAVKAFWPLLVLVLLRQNSGDKARIINYFLIIPAFIILRSVIDYFYLRFYIKENNLILRKGFISKKIITIPLERIHTVNLDQHFVHKIFNITSLKVDTAGSSKSEAVIDALEFDKAEALKKYLLSESRAVNKTEDSVAEGNDGFIDEKPSKTILNADLKDIFKIGITANHIQAFFIIFAFLVSAIQNLEEIFGDRVINLLKESTSGISYTVNLILITGLGVLLITMIVSLVRSLLLYMNFFLVETGRGYKIEWGLLNTREVLIPYDKIQYISWKANWLRSLLGIYMLDFHQATSTDTDNRKTKMYIPLTKKEDIPVLLNQYHPALDINEESHFYKIDKRYIYRKTLLRGLPVAVLPFVIGYFFWEMNAAWFLLYLPFEFFSAAVYQRKFQLYTHPDALQIISGVWGKEVEVLKWYKIQVPEIKRSLYQRRTGLATVKLHTAGGVVTIPYIDYELALKIYNWALYKVESYRQGSFPAVASSGA